MTASEPDRLVKLFGTEIADAPSRTLTAGPLAAELDNGALRYIRLNGVEVIRAIAFLVRDENWGTWQPEIADLHVGEDAGRFTVSYRARCGAGDRRLSYAARIVGRADGSLEFEADATAHGDFVTNRTGFIVLHPLEGCAGCPVRVLHTDGRQVADRFPEIIDPVQPFFDIRALSHEALPGVWVTCRMEGDAFEMEDHRNWTDASYKTYVRPLALPWPYTIPKCTEFSQSVTLTVDGRLPAMPAAGARPPVRVEVGAPGAVTMPRIGLGLPAAEAGPAQDALDLVRQVGPQLLVCRVDPRHGHGVAELESYRRLGEALAAAVTLEIVLPCLASPADELRAVAGDAAKAGLKPSAIAVSPAPDLKAVLPGSKGAPVPPLEEIYAAARAAFPGVALGGGMFSFFTELNRKRPPAQLLDFVTHTTNPIVHAADDRSVMETLEALPYVVKSARAFIAGRPYRVGPSAIAARDNPYGAASASNPDNRRVCLADTDPRQRGLFGAAWTLGYVAALARGGLEAVSIGAPTGPMGLVYRRTPHPQPFFDGLGAPAVYPAFHVVAGLARGAGRPQVPAVSSAPRRVDCIAWRGSGGTVLWLANLTGEEQQVALAGALGKSAILRLIDEDGFVAMTTRPKSFRAAGEEIRSDAPLRLKPYAVACLEFGSR